MLTYILDGKIDLVWKKRIVKSLIKPKF